jgi:hypothetical protein
MKLSDLTTDQKWQSTYRGFRFPNSPKKVVWSQVEVTSHGKYRISRNIKGDSWANRRIVRYSDPEQAVVLVPLTI